MVSLTGCEAWTRDPTDNWTKFRCSANMRACVYEREKDRKAFVRFGEKERERERERECGSETWKEKRSHGYTARKTTGDLFSAVHVRVNISSFLFLHFSFFLFLFSLSFA